jgi:hypothetical protein
MNINTLKRKASACAARRGHRMAWGAPFQHNGGWGLTGTCIRCNKWVQVLTLPQPNQIDLGGNAVAENCEK